MLNLAWVEVRKAFKERYQSSVMALKTGRKLRRWSELVILTLKRGLCGAWQHGFPSGTTACPGGNTYMEGVSKALELSARPGLSARVPLHLDWSLFMLLRTGVDVVWLFLGTNEQTPDSFQKSIRGLWEACPWVATHCLTSTQVTVQALSITRVPCATCRPVDRRVFSPPAITACLYKLREALWESCKSSLTFFEAMFRWKDIAEAAVWVLTISQRPGLAWLKPLRPNYKVERAGWTVQTEWESLGGCILSCLAKVFQDKKVRPCLPFPVWLPLPKLRPNYVSVNDS